MNKISKRTRHGSLAINQTMLLVLGIVVLVIVAGFYIFLGGKAEEMVTSVIKFPSA